MVTVFLLPLTLIESPPVSFTVRLLPPPAARMVFWPPDVSVTLIVAPPTEELIVSPPVVPLTVMLVGLVTVSVLVLAVDVLPGASVEATVYV